MANATARKFGHPTTVVAETDHWLVQVRPQQPALGSLVLVAKAEATAFGQLGPEAFADLQPVVRRLEAALKRLMDYDKINYLMLMMVDPDVHFHVIPRHGAPRRFGAAEFVDAGWPGPPALGQAVALEGEPLEALVKAVKDAWDQAASTSSAS